MQPQACGITVHRNRVFCHQEVDNAFTTTDPDLDLRDYEPDDTSWVQTVSNVITIPLRVGHAWFQLCTACGRSKRRMPLSTSHNLSVVYTLRVVNNRKVVHNGEMGRFDPAPTLAAGLLRLARDMASMTQTDLAVQAGVSQQSISAYETGRKEPTLPTLVRLLAAAGTEMRIRLEPIDDHDSTLATFIETLPSSRQAELIEESRARVAAERLDRIRGK